MLVFRDESENLAGARKYIPADGLRFIKRHALRHVACDQVSSSHEFSSIRLENLRRQSGEKSFPGTITADKSDAFSVADSEYCLIKYGLRTIPDDESATAYDGVGPGSDIGKNTPVASLLPLNPRHDEAPPPSS